MRIVLQQLSHWLLAINAQGDVKSLQKRSQ